MHSDIDTKRDQTPKRQKMHAEIDKNVMKLQKGRKCMLRWIKTRSKPREKKNAFKCRQST